MGAAVRDAGDEPLPTRRTATGIRFDVRLTPRASRTAIVGVRDGRLHVRVSAPPVDRAANDALIAVIAEALNLPQRAVAIVSGLTARQKTLEVRETSEAAIQQLARR